MTYAHELIPIVALLAAAVIAVALFKRLGLGSVLGYLAAGLLVGPFGIGIVSEPRAVLHIAELGVILLLFMIGLEMQPRRLWGLRRQIFGVGLLQILVCGLLLTVAGYALGFAPAVAFIAGMGFVLSSTAIVLQILEERGEVAGSGGQQIVSVLLLEDLAIVPLLLVVPLLAPPRPEVDGGVPAWLSVLLAFGAVALLLGIGRWLINPIFRLLAAARAREVMTAAALLVVLGSALLLGMSGLSMALGAFIAGVLLSESTFRHELEADIEPFRGILLGLFFIGVGMTLDLSVFRGNWDSIVLLVGVFAAVKASGIVLIGRLTGASRAEAGHRAVLMIQGGEFAFVLYSAAAAAGILDARSSAVLTAAVTVSMALTPLGVILWSRLPQFGGRTDQAAEAPYSLVGEVLVIGFGRFGQVVSQTLLAKDLAVAIIDNDTRMIQSAARFGFKVYFGDGTRLDVLRASGASQARVIAVCVDDRAAAGKIAELVQSQFPQARLIVRAYDRQHALELLEHGVAQPVRETFDSALVFGHLALAAAGVEPDEAADIVADVRRRDRERFESEVVGGFGAGKELMRGNLMAPEPLLRPKRFLEPSRDE